MGKRGAGALGSAPGEPVQKAQLTEIFKSLPTETSVDEGKWQRYYPTRATFKPTQFYIPGSTQFIDLTQCWLELKMKLVKADGTSFGDTEIDVGVVNNMGHSVIKRFDVKLNNTSTGEPTDLYHMKAYVQSLLNFTPEQKESYLACEGWYGDDAGATKMNANKTCDGLNTALAATDAAYNKGFLERTALFVKDMGKTGQKSQEVTFLIQPCVDIFQTGRHLLPGIPIDIQIDYNDDALVVMAADGATHKIVITSAVFIVRHVDATDSVHLNILAEHKKLGKAIYPLRTTKPIRFTLERGKQSFIFSDIFQKSVPDILTVGIIEAENFNGKLSKNPFVCELQDLKDIRWLVNGSERPSARLEIKSPDMLEAYHTLCESSGNLHRGFSPGIKRKDYKDGYAWMRFNFTPDGKDAKNYTYKMNEGTLDLHLEFTNNLTKNCVLFLLPEFENELWIDDVGVVSMKSNY